MSTSDKQSAVIILIVPLALNLKPLQRALESDSALPFVSCVQTVNQTKSEGALVLFCFCDVVKDSGTRDQLTTAPLCDWIKHVFIEKACSIRLYRCSVSSLTNKVFSRVQSGLTAHQQPKHRAFL